MSSLDELVAAWLPTQRWFGGKGRDVASITVEPLAGLGATEILLAHVTYADAASERYQVPVVQREAAAASLEHVLIGTTGDGRWVYDALHDKDVTAAWLAGIRDGRHDGPVTFERVATPDAIPVDEPSLASTAEQSNTSLRYGDAAILKVFRRLQPGISPDVEVQGALTRLGATHVAPLLGHVTCEIEGEPTSLAMLQEFMTTASDGWDLAGASVRDLMAEADLHADEAGGDFAAEAQRLGAAVAEVHRDLRKAFGVARLGADTWRARVETMRSRLEDAVSAVPALAELADGLRATYDRAALVQAEGLEVQRIHGDLHLGQALRTAQRWVLIDFEGEPMLTLSERRAPDSPLRDVAGMLRSFDYAGHHRVVEVASGSAPQVAYRANEWTARNSDAFCAGYAEAAGEDPRAQAAVLAAFEVEKAVYEAVYESRNRPSWLPIPLTALRTLADRP